MRLEYQMAAVAACILYVGCTGSFAFAAAVELRDPMIDEGSVAVPVAISAERGDKVASLQFDVHFDRAAFEVYGVTEGNSAADALKQVIILVYYQGLKYREAADVLSIPVGTVKSRLHGAVYKLSVLLTDTSLASYE